MKNIQICIIIKFFESYYRNMVQLLTIPTIVVATHYDQFLKLELEKQKWTAKALRFLCHSRGASLVYTSHQDEPSINKVKLLYYQMIVSSLKDY